MIYIFATIFVLGVLVFVHELGHFLVAKLSGIRVEKFSLGFGPRMIGKTVGHTDYRISWIPLGGYCKMAGMVDESLDSDTIGGHDWEFQSKSTMTRLAVIVAGPVMNFLLAFLILVLVGLVWGSEHPLDSSVVGVVEPDFPAAAAGIVPGDVIISLDGQAVSLWSELVEYIHARPGETVHVEWRHGEEVRGADMVPRRDRLPMPGAEPLEVGRIGIVRAMEHMHLGFVGAVVFGYERSLGFAGMIFNTLKGLVSGEASMRSLGGPIFIGKMAGDSASAGMMPLLVFMAFLSINLGLLNLLPLPVLDGGHVVIIAIEGLARRPLPIRVKLAVLQMGFVLLMALMAFVIYNDISRLLMGAQ